MGEYARWLVRAMDLAGIKGGALARHLGTDRKQVHRYRHGESIPPFAVHLRACELLVGSCPLEGVEALQGSGSKEAAAYLRGVIDGAGNTESVRESLVAEVRT